AYSPVYNTMLLGGGDNQQYKIWKLGSDRSITALTDSPVKLGVQSGLVTLEPVTGKFIFYSDPTHVYIYDPTGSGTLNMIATTPSFLGNYYGPSPSDMFAVPISTYGVVAFVRCNTNNCRMFLYKHALSGSPTTPPPQTIDTTAPAVSITSPGLGATASGPTQ